MESRAGEVGGYGRVIGIVVFVMIAIIGCVLIIYIIIP
jgi:hypothetical protein